MTERTKEERLAALREARVVLVSACLMGELCRYDGKSKSSSRVGEALAGKEVVPMCPEAGAGMGIPRPAVELTGGTGEEVLEGRARVVTVGTREDRTEQMRRGAEMAVKAAQRFGATVAVLKERSPSCGTQGTHVDGVVVPGRGVAAALLHAAGITVLSDEDLNDHP